MHTTKVHHGGLLLLAGLVVLVGGAWWAFNHQSLNPNTLLGQPYADWQQASSVAPTKVVTADAADGHFSMNDSAAPWNGFTVTTAGKQPTLTLDFGQLVLGTPVISIGSTGGGDVLLAYTEEVNGTPVNELTQTTGFSLTPNQSAITDSPRLFRYLTISFRNHPQSTTVTSIRLTDIRQGNRIGFFSSSDSKLNAIWQLAAHSVELSTAKTFIDSPQRDNATWLGDAREIQRADAYLNRNRTVADATLAALASHVRPDGAIVAVNALSPDNHEDWVFLDYVSRFVSLVRDHYQEFGDKAVLNQFGDLALQQLAYLQGKTNADGLLVAPGDLAPANDWSSTNRIGVVAYQQVAYWQGLVDGAAIETARGNQTKATELTNRADQLKATTISQLTDPTTGLLKDFLPSAGVEPAHIPLDANILAIDAGWYSANDASARLTTLETKLGADHGWKALDEPYQHITGRFDIAPLMNAYAVEALFKAGKDTEAIQLTQSVWGTMLNQGATTAWEFLSNDGKLAGSVSHGWSGTIARVLQQDLLGIAPGIDANHWTISPHVTDDASLAGAVPTNRGILALTSTKSGSSYTVTIQVPSGLVATFVAPIGMKVDGKASITLSGGRSYSLTIQ